MHGTFFSDTTMTENSLVGLHSLAQNVLRPFDGHPAVLRSTSWWSGRTRSRVWSLGSDVWSSPPPPAPSGSWAGSGSPYTWPRLPPPEHTPPQCWRRNQDVRSVKIRNVSMRKSDHMHSSLTLMGVFLKVQPQLTTLRSGKEQEVILFSSWKPNQ